MSDRDRTTAVEIREIPGAVGYGVDADGGVWSRKKLGRPYGLTDTWRPLKQSTDSVGYKSVGITWDDGTHRTARVHTLVLLTFVGPCPPGMEACHDPDRTRTNNRLSNLRWGTRSDNMKDAVRHGTHVRGPGKDKLTEETVKEIRRLGRAGKFGTEISRLLPVSASNACSILHGKTWKHVK